MMKKRLLAMLAAGLVLLSGCAQQGDKTTKAMQEWVKTAQLSAHETPQELYQKALNEDTLVIYTITTRITEVKESFEKQYPGLHVEIRDVRSTEVVDMVAENAASGRNECDIVICNDNSGELSAKLVDTGLIYPYIPYDIAPKLKEGHGEDQLYYLDEAQMFFYNSAIYDEVPIQNIWQLCEAQYKGEIYMPSPLRSFSTYGFCAMVLAHPNEMEQAWRDYAGTPLEVPEGKTASEVFFERLVQNVHFTNSSDEVAEAVGSAAGTGHFGLVISSKQRLNSVGYHMAPIYKLDPFSGSYASTSAMIAGGAKNINSAKLFIRWLLGEADGTGEGYKPYQTAGTWSPRTDVPDGNDVPLSEIDLLWLDKEYMKDNRDEIDAFFSSILKTYGEQEQAN